MGIHARPEAPEYPTHWKNLSVLPPLLAHELSVLAGQMRGDAGAPVLLRTICDRLGIKIMRSGRVENGKAYLEWDRSTDTAPLIMLPLRDALAWDRFCAAHELGHYVLISNFSYHPESESEYWQTEVLCDHFARELLLPDRLFEIALSRHPESVLLECDRIARSAKVPWLQVAKKVTRLCSRVFLMRLTASPDGSFKVASTSLPLDKGRGRKIDARSSVSTKALAALGKAQEANRPVTIRLSRDDFVGCRLGELFSELAVQEIVARTDLVGSALKLAAVR